MKQAIVRISAAFLVISICSSFIYGIFGKRCGIKGFVYELKGNQMPSPDEKRTPPKGISTSVFIYESTSQSQTTAGERPGFYKTVNSKLVKEVKTDDKGYFEAALPAGHYSLFTKVDGQFYANLFDQENRIYPVEVKKRKWTDVVIKQDHNAAY